MDKSPTGERSGQSGFAAKKAGGGQPLWQIYITLL
jgi:hypothetical protein